MKKILIIFIILLCLVGCKTKNDDNNKDDRYLNLVDSLANHDFSQCTDNSCQLSKYFDITYEIANTNDGYRYYVIIDNPKNAMYGVEIVVAELGVDYKINMAANAGIFEEKEYNMIPGQTNVEEGYVGGISVSGVTTNAAPTINVLVQWHSKKQEIHQEFYRYSFALERGN